MKTSHHERTMIRLRPLTKLPFSQPQSEQQAIIQSDKTRPDHAVTETTNYEVIRDKNYYEPDSQPRFSRSPTYRGFDLGTDLHVTEKLLEMLQPPAYSGYDGPMNHSDIQQRLNQILRDIGCGSHREFPCCLPYWTINSFEARTKRETAYSADPLNQASTSKTNFNFSWKKVQSRS